MERVLINKTLIQQVKKERSAGKREIAVSFIQPPENNRIDTLQKESKRILQELALAKE